jgi:hypothetical protein
MNSTPDEDRIWSPWYTSPFTAIGEIAQPGDWPKVKEVVAQSMELWSFIVPEEYLDELLQEIAGWTNIVVQTTSSTGTNPTIYRASYDT